MKQAILMIDDEVRANVFYKRALDQSGYAVTQIREVDEAVAYVADGANTIDLIILDIMMAPGQYQNREDIQQGLRTGIFVYEDIRRCRPNVPVLVLTNRRLDALSPLTQGSHLKIVRKPETPPFDLVEFVKGMLLAGP